ncbi:hypothetical protein [Runella aurantiaca]|uniref:DUF2029 domain-containing protein n=1 Tax=Runella aurantiaca TaxID=2282308 RepID=A0A369I5E3_9BACT|nr:hypothetical protein [Runella aurantiaca]RDB04120.1 hypothetical protein DVG78_20270 [Runella aurantiaca]
MKEKGWIGMAAVLSALAVYLLYAFFQPTYTYALLDGRYDAHQYAKAYNYFKGFTANYEVAFPFNTRILMPWLAAYLPFNELVTDFVWLNGVFILATIGLLTWIWLKLNIRLFWIAIALFWILFHWKGLVRMYLPDPVTADVGGYFLLTSFLALLLIEEKKFSKAWLNCLFVLIAVLGTLQKEAFIAVLGMTVLLTGKNSDTAGIIKPLLLSFCLSIAVYCLVAFYFPAASTDWRNNSIVSVLRGMKRYAEHPDLFLSVPVSWFLAYGTFWLALLPFRFLKAADDSTSRFSLLIPHFFLWLFLSVFGGGDTTRILYNGMPFVLTFLVLRLNQLPIWMGGYVLLTSLPLMRLSQLEPDLGRYPNEMPQWCVECWTLRESWGYWVYAVAVLAGYYYLSRRLGAIGSDESNEVNALR